MLWVSKAAVRDKGEIQTVCGGPVQGAVRLGRAVLRMADVLQHPHPADPSLLGEC